MTTAPTSTQERPGATAGVPAQRSRRSAAPAEVAPRHLPRASRTGALAVEVSTVLGRVRSASTSPSGLHLLGGLLVTAVTGAAAALLLAPA